jgi:galactokinase
MAIDRGTTVSGRRAGREIHLVSDAVPGDARFELPAAGRRRLRQEGWGRLVEAVAAACAGPSAGGSDCASGPGFTGRVSSDLPIGAGLASSASLEVAVAQALGHPGPAVELARLCQDAELRATGVPCGIMDPLVSAAGVAGHALLIDCSDLSIVPVPFPDDVEVVVVHSGEERQLAGSPYADRRRACEEAARLIGPLRSASLDDVAELADPELRRRARHVVSENARVRAFAGILAAGARLAGDVVAVGPAAGDVVAGGLVAGDVVAGDVVASDLVACGELMVESHRSLAGDFEVSTDRLDQMVEDLTARPGVFGARLTGAGFGGCVVVLARPGAVTEGWRVRPSGGAFVVVEGGG